MASIQEALARPIRRVGDTPVVGPVVKGAAFAAGTYIAARALFGTPTGLMLYASALGALYGLLGASIIIVYRTNRIVNFAVGAMGAAPAVFALTLYTNKGWSYWAVLPLALVGGPLLGALVNVAVIRRFSDAPRLILTVVTIGLAQLLAFVAFLTPNWLGVRGLPDQVRTPFSGWEIEILGDRITGDYIVAAVVVAVLAAGLGAFFKFTRMGIAIRASAENADRALTLGIPVNRVSMVAWTIAGFFSVVTVFLRSPLVGLPLGGLASAGILLYALTSAVIGRMESIPMALAGGIAIGVMDQSSVYKTGRSDLAIALMLVVILVALFLQRTGLSRAHDTGVSSFRAVKEFRPIPLELRHLPEVRWAKAAVAAVVAIAALTAPWYLGNELGKGSLVVISAIVAVSLVVLTGWAGQISLGQFAFVGIGATVAGGLAANHN
ncbi:MAG: ABC transporter permease subunit, partial [Actinomycetota bacterium]